MKRDLNLCRAYLLDMAGESAAGYDSPNKVHLYHIGLLHNSGLIDIDNNYSLTMKGHDVVSLIRDDNTWDYIMSVSDKVGGLPFDMILEYAKESLAQKVDEAVKDKRAVETQNSDDSLNKFQHYIDAVNKVGKVFNNASVGNDDSDFVKKDLVFTRELDQKFNETNIHWIVADAYILTKHGSYKSALLRLNSYIKDYGMFAKDTIEFAHDCADEIKFLLDVILDNLPFN